MFLDPHFRSQLRREMPLTAIAVPRVVEDEATRLVPEHRATVHQAASFTTMSQLPYAGDHTHRLFTELCETLPGHRIELGRDRAGLTGSIREFLANGGDPVRTNGTPERPVAAPLVSVIIP